MPETPLTAREVQEALEERISKGVYTRGERLPPVRSIASEFGSSPSTVSRALQEMVRNGWLEVQERQFVRVRNELPPRAIRSADIQRAIRSIAHKWKLWGGGQDELLNTIREFVREVFESDVQFVFTECNEDDLAFMGDQVASELGSVRMGRELIEKLDPADLLRRRAVVVVPYYHYAEVREKVGDDVPIVPIHSSPSTETLDELLTIPPDARVLVVGHNKRSVSRLSGMVRDYSGATIVGLTKDQTTKIAKELPSADVVVTVSEATDVLEKWHADKRLIVVRFVMESSLRSKLSAAEDQHKLISPAVYRQ
jgi:DNA-binding transcriptional regulator YhcF (GntR family)